MVRRRQVILSVVAGISLLGAGGAWWMRAELRAGWWTTRGGWELSESESAALAACRDPGWGGWTKVLVQDLDLTCDEHWVAVSIAEHWSRPRGRWLRELAMHPARPARSRLRAGAAVLEHEGEPVAGLSLLVSEPALADAREAMAESLADEEQVPVWADPLLQEDVAAWQLAGGELEAAPLVGRALRREGGDPERRAWLVKTALDAVGLSAPRLADIASRHGSGRPVFDIPAAVAVRVVNDGAACEQLDSPRCVDLATFLLDELAGADEGEWAWSRDREPSTPDGSDEQGLAELWSARFGTADEQLRGRVELVRSVGAWIRAADPDERAGRLLGTVAHPRHTYDPQGRGDPAAVLRARRGSPWATAAAALYLGTVTDVDVEVSALPEGVLLRVGERRAGVGSGGSTLAVPEQVGPAWPYEAVLAQAALEAAGARAEAGDPEAAMRLLAFAQRTDPVGAAGALDAGGEPSLGQLAGRSVLWLEQTPPSGAEDARRARAGAWRTPE